MTNKNNYPYYRDHRARVKDIIYAFAQLFYKIDWTDEQKKWLLTERLSAKQWRYIAKIESEMDLSKIDIISNDLDFNDMDSIKLGKLRAPNGLLVDSRGEALISIILDDLNISYQNGVFLPKYGVNSDFVIFDNENIKCIIEYWGLTDNIGYDVRKQQKIRIYNKNNIKLINIEATEVDDCPSLKKRLSKILEVI